MRFARDLTAVTRHVSEVVSAKDELWPVDLPLALAGHTALVQLVRHLHPSVTGLTPPPSWWAGRADSEAHPVAALGRLLARHPTLADLSPSEVQVLPAQTRLGVAFQQVARHATLTIAGWDASDTARRPEGEQRWAVLAPVAALSQALWVLDVNLAQALAGQGRDEDAAALTTAATSGLGPVAAAVLQLAQQRPPAPVRLYPAPTTVLRVDGAAVVAAGQQRLARLLVAPRTEVHPVDVTRLCVSQRAGADRAAALVARTHPQVATGLRAYAAALAQVRAGLRRTQSVGGRNVLAVAQGQQVHQFLHRVDDEAGVDAALGFARHAGGVAAALHARTEASIKGGLWLTVSEEESGPVWCRSFARCVPSVVDGLQRAVLVTGALQVTAPAGGSSPLAEAVPAGPPELAVLISAVADRAEALQNASTSQGPVLPSPRAEVSGHPLSPEELFVLKGLAAGTAKAVLAEQLSVSRGTVENRCFAAVAKLRGDAVPPPGYYTPRRTTVLAAQALSVVSALAAAEQARTEVDRLAQSAARGPDHREQTDAAGKRVNRAHADVGTARRRLIAYSTGLVRRQAGTDRAAPRSPVPVSAAGGTDAAARRLQEAQRRAISIESVHGPSGPRR